MVVAAKLPTPIGRAIMSVYSVSMARLNVYVPDDLAEAARQSQLNVSSVTQDALRREVARRSTDRWLARLRRLPATGIGHSTAVASLDAVRAEEGDVWPGHARRSP